MSCFGIVLFQKQENLGAFRVILERSLKDVHLLKMCLQTVQYVPKVFRNKMAVVCGN